MMQIKRKRIYLESLFTLLPSIELSTTLRQVKIKAQQEAVTQGFQASWLNDLWSYKSKSLKELYQNKEYEICLKSIKTDEEIEDVIWIRKIAHR